VSETATTSTPTVELLDFWAEWCGPCKIMEPVIHELEAEYKGQLVIKPINVDEAENQSLMEQYHILSVPTYILLKDGEVKDHFLGVQPKDVVAKKIQALLQPGN
jgi:thioredoxin 1